MGHEAKPFHVTREGFFGANTLDGGADKAAHFADYFVISKEFAYIFGKLGFSESSALLLGLGTAMVGGALNEVGDGFSQPGFSYEDIVMDWLGAGTATLLLATRMDDLLGVRTSHLDGYPHDVFSADLKLSGLARRLNINIGPLRYLLFSVTYGTKGYPDGPVAERQRQVGVEIGLNLEQILSDLGVTRDTWWGYALHFAGDNARWPFTAVGFRFDLNHSKWHGPNSGNFPERPRPRQLLLLVSVSLLAAVRARRCARRRSFRELSLTPAADACPRYRLLRHDDERADCQVRRVRAGGGRCTVQG